MAMDFIRIRGARTHNLKNLDLDLPRDKLIVITGLSGSGKSSLAFDTIYAEGQRRYVESLSAYARQFLSVMEKPDVDHIEGLSPASRSNRSRPRTTRARPSVRSPRSTTTCVCSTPASAPRVARTMVTRWKHRPSARWSTRSWRWTRSSATCCWPR
jgi:Excinuclease ATPase subunit